MTYLYPNAMHNRVHHIALGVVAVMALWLGVRGSQLWEKNRRIEAAMKGEPVSVANLAPVVGVRLDSLKIPDRYFFGLVYNPMTCDCSIGRIRNDLAAIDSLMQMQGTEYDAKIFFLGTQEKLGNLLVEEMNSAFDGLSSYRELDTTTVRLLPRQRIGDGLLLVMRPGEQHEGMVYKLGVLLQPREKAANALLATHSLNLSNETLKEGER